ncbi:MAG: Calx-beta domain-containing protein, partial [Chloroflexales bacterium]
MSVSTRTFTRVPTTIVQTPSPTPTRNIGRVSPSATPISNPGDVTATVPVTSTPTPTTTHTPTTTPTRTTIPTLTKTTGNVATPTQIVIPTSTATATATATATPAVTLAFASSAISASEAQGTVTVTVNLSIQPAGASRTNTVSVHYATSDGSAKAGIGRDYIATSGTLYFPPGTNTAAITITVLPDAIKELDKVAFITLSAPNGATFGGTDTATLTITDASAPPVVNMVADASSVSESVGRTAFWIVLSQPTAYDVTVPYIIGGSATAGSDYSGLSSGTVVVPAGVQKVRLPFTIINDQIAENSETISATLGSPTNASRGTSATITIVDDDTAGVNVSPLSGSSTSEAGSSVTFSVWLNSQPTASVVVPITSSDTTEGAVSPANLTFTAANWNKPQTITVTGVRDFVVDGPIIYTVQIVPVMSADPFYSGKFAQTIGPLTNTDNNTAGVNVSTPGSNSTSEAGGSVTFNVWLNSEPTGNVTIPITSNDQTEGTVSPTSLTFTPTTWMSAQVVTVTGVDDFVNDGNIAYTVSVGPATGADALYRSLAARTVNLINIDNDIAGITADPVSGPVAEGGATATIRLVLNSQPTADVVITATADTQLYVDGMVSTVLTITPDTWNTARIITVSAVDDLIAEGPHSGGITFSVDSADPLYRPLKIAPATVQIADNDVPPDLVISAQSGTTTSENLDTVTFKVALTRQPLADVTVPISSSNTGEGTVGPASLTFTAANWNVPQTVTVTGVNDAIADGDIAYNVQVGPTSSSSVVYNGVGLKTIPLTNLDNDTAGVIVTPATPILSLAEGGRTSSYTVVLGSQPLADVTIAVSADARLRVGIPAPALPALSLTFTPGNWNQPQTVTVSAFDDAIAQISPDFRQVTHSATSADPKYNAITIASVGANITDNDSAGITVNPMSGLITTESGGTATFGVVLTSEPTANVTIALASSNTAEGTVSSSSLTFTATNWNVPQTVTVTGVNDFVVDGNINYTVTVGPTSSSDPFYSGMAIKTVSLSNSDNDSVGVNVSATSGTTSEAGGTMTFSVWLNSQPTATVTIPLISSNTTEGTVSPASLTFTAANWNVPQTVTVTGVDDFVVDGPVAYTVTVGPTSSADPLYSGTLTQTVNVVNLDNDTADVTITNVTLPEGNVGTTAFAFTVNLSNIASRDVSVDYTTVDQAATVAGNDYAAATGTLTIPAGNSSGTITVNVTGDTSIEPDETFLVQLSNLRTSGIGAIAVTLAGAQGTGTITNDDYPTVTLSNPSVLEGNAGTSILNFVATFASAVPSAGTLTYSTVDGAATAASGDYVAVTNVTVPFAAGATSVSLPVTINGDTTLEPDEIFSVSLIGAISTGVSGTGTITNDDYPTVTFNAPSVLEGNAGTRTLNFVATFASATLSGGTLTYSTVDGTATVANNDYVAVTNGIVPFAAGATSVSLPVTVNGDTTQEPDETLRVSLSGVGAPASATGTILNDDPGVTLSAPSVLEGDAGTRTLTFVATFATPPLSAGFVTYSTADGTATAASGDYVAVTNGTVAFLANATSVDLPVTVNGDTTQEPHETLSVSLSGVGAPASATGTITNDDYPVMTMSSPKITEGNAGTSTLTFVVNIPGGAPSAGALIYSTADGLTTVPATAATVANNDYVPVTNATVNFLAGATSVNLPVTINGDTNLEPDETFSVILGGTISAGVSGTGTITNDDYPTVTFNTPAPTVLEGNAGTSTLTFVATFASATLSGGTLTYSTVDGTAIAASGDYVAVTNVTVPFAAGVTSVNLSVTVNGDTIQEPDETLSVILGGTISAGLSSTVGTITNDDPGVTFNVPAPSVPEGDAGTTSTLTFVATFATPPLSAGFVTYSTADGTATVANNDYVPVTNGTVNFLAGATSVNLPVTINGDATLEPDETLSVSLSGVGAPASATGTITNDDYPAVTFNVPAPTEVEGDVGTRPLTFVATFASATLSGGTLTYSTVDGTAIAASGDYVAVTNGTVAFGVGATSVNLPVTINGDTTLEPDETLSVILGGTISAGVSSTGGTITNDDYPAVTFNAPTVLEGNAGTSTLTFVATFATSPLSGGVLTYSTADGTATVANNDYVAVTNVTVPFAAGAMSVNLPVTVNGDTIQEPDETLTVSLSGVGAPASAIGTITNDDPGVTFNVPAPSVPEGDAGTTSTLTFVATFATPPLSAGFVTYSTADGTATVANNDYVPVTNGTVNFLAGATSVNLPVTINGDATLEPDETLSVSLSGVGAPASATGTITNDDYPAVTFNPPAPTVLEGDAGTRPLTFVATFAAATLSGGTLTYSTVDGTAIAASGDYVAVTNGTVAFGVGATSVNLPVTINGDTTLEPDETLSVILGGTISAGVSSTGGTITNDDYPAVTFNAPAPTVLEGDAGTRPLTFVATFASATLSGGTLTYS